jgi:hypothetical protein
VDSDRQSINDENDRSDEQQHGDSILDVVEQVRSAGEGEDPKVSDIVEALGGASFGPLMLIPALLIVSPLSGIPGLPTIAGISIAVVAAQMVWGREHVWLPGWIMRRQMNRSRFDRALDFLKKPARFMDYITRPRLTWIVTRPFSLVLQVLCLIAGLSMPPLELIPLSSAVVATGVVFFSVAIITRDGVVAIIGLIAVIGGIYLLLNLLGYI